MNLSLPRRQTILKLLTKMKKNIVQIWPPIKSQAGCRRALLPTDDSNYQSCIRQCTSSFIFYRYLPEAQENHFYPDLLEKYHSAQCRVTLHDQPCQVALASGNPGQKLFSECAEGSPLCGLWAYFPNFPE